MISKYSYFSKPLSFAAAIFLLAAVSSCGSDDYLNPSQVENGTAMSIPDEITLSPTGDAYTIDFTADGSWTIEGKPGWLDASRISGRKGTTSIVLSTSMNTTKTDRSVTLNFVVGGYTRRSLYVKQPCPYLYLRRVDDNRMLSQKDSLGFVWNNVKNSYSGVTIDTTACKIAIESNVGWRISGVTTLTKSPQIDLNHFSVSTLEGIGDGQLNVIPTDVNFGKSPYDMTAHVKAVYTDDSGNVIDIPDNAITSYDILLHQNNLRFLINDLPEDAQVVIDEVNSNKNINLTIDCEEEWTVQNRPSWVELSRTSRDGIVTLNIQADGPNPDRTPRTGVVTLTTADGAFRNIVVTQKPYRFTLSGQDLTIGNDDLSDKTMTLVTTGTWAVQDIPSWLTVSPTGSTRTFAETGDSVYVITIKARSQNLNFNDNVSSLNFVSTMNKISQSVPVHQDKFVFDVDLSSASSLSDLPTMSTQQYPVNVNSSGKWAIEGKPDWVSVSQTSSDAKGSFALRIGAATANPDITADRSAALSVVSLNHREAGQNVTRTIPIKQRKFTFEVEHPSSVSIPAYKRNFDTFSATVKCSSDWTLDTCPSWLTPNVSSGNGQNDVTIVFTPSVNTSKTSRDGVVRIKSTYNGETVSFNVSQDGFVFDSGSESFNVPVMNSATYNVSFNLTAEAPWALLDYDQSKSWIQPTATSGTGASGTSSISFRPDPNPNLDVRTATVTIRSTLTGEDKVITFSQEKYEFDSSAQSFSFTELDTGSRTASITSSGPWTISDAPSWITPSPREGDSSGSITITTSKNTSLSERSSSFHVVSTLNNLSKEISVSQDAYRFDTSSLSYTYGTLEERTDAFDVVSSGKWTASGAPSWVTLSKSSGDGGEGGARETVSITSTINLTLSQRNATIRITSADNSSLVKTITLNQAAFVFNVSEDPIRFSSPIGSENEAVSVSVECSAGWTVTSDSDWIKVTPSSGFGNSTFNVSVDSNTSTSERTGVLTVTSTENGLTKSIVVTQEGTSVN